MIELNHLTRNKKDTHGKPRVYFTCHPDDFNRCFHGDEYSCFNRICEDILSLQQVDCVIYYTSDMSQPLSDDIKEDLATMNLVVVPVTKKLLTEPSRAMEEDIAFAKEHNINILPFMMEPELDLIYGLPKNFGSLQYINPYSTNPTEVDYHTKLIKRLNELFVGKELVEKIRNAFDSYIFLSYRKMDRKLANQLMRRIHNINGYRDVAIWYDEYLVPGESWSENIQNAMKMVQQKSNIFALLVTPNILKMVIKDGKEHKNYVMEHEYPDAKDAKMLIIPAEMECIDHTVLGNEFPEIPHCVDVYGESFVSAMMDALGIVSDQANDNDPEHLYYIGLAYVNGIDIEIDRERGIDLLTRSAEAGYLDAIEWLFRYYKGRHDHRSHKEALKWAMKLVEYHILNDLGVEKYIKAIRKLAIAYDLCSMYDEAFDAEHGAYNLFTSSKIDDEEQLLSIMNSLAMRYAKCGKHDRAAKMFREVYDGRLNLYGDLKNHLVLDTGYALGSALHDCGKYNEAASIKQKIYEIYCEVYHENHSMTLRSRWNLAITLVALADKGDKQALGQALEHLKESVEVYKKYGMEEHPDALMAQEVLGDVYMRRGEKHEAFLVYRMVAMLRIMNDPFQASPDTVRAVEKTEALLDTCGKDLDNNLNWEEKYTSLCEDLGPRDPETIKAGVELVKAAIKVKDMGKAMLLIKELRSNARFVLHENDQTLKEINKLYKQLSKMYK